MDRFDVIVIGAGISGLSLAHFFSFKGLKVLVLEKNERIGGCLHSEKFGDFWIEMGAHTCYNSYTNLIKIIEDCKALDLIIPRKKVPFKMLSGNEIKSIPSQLNIPELIFSLPKIFFVKKTQNSVRDYYSKILGKNNYERVIGPAVNAVLSQDGDDFPAEILFKRRKRRKDIIKKFTFKEGLETIVRFIAVNQNISIIKGIEISEIKYDNNKFFIFTNNNSFESPFLGLSVPPPEAARFLKDPFPDLHEKLALIKTSRVNSIGVIVKRDLVNTILPIAGLIPHKDNFYSIVSRDPVQHSTYRGFVFHFKPQVSHNEGLKRIRDLLKVDMNQIEYVVKKENVVPSLKVGHYMLVNFIDNLISKRPLMLTGNYFEGMAIEDCVIRSYKEYSRITASFLSSHGG
jgi:protoporphyrinogen oxidase